MYERNLLPLVLLLAYGSDLLFLHSCSIWLDLLATGASGYILKCNFVDWLKKRKEASKQ